jgi:hypothetical protein
MSTGVLMYCFNTPHTAYHRIAERSIALVKKNLGLPITLVTDTATHNSMSDNKNIDYKIIEKTNISNYRFYRTHTVPWYNMERARAYEHSPYDCTLLLDCDYFCYTPNLLELTKTDYDFLLHDRVNDITGLNRIQTRLESILPIVWATVVMFKRTDRVRMIFDMIQCVQKNYEHFRNLYRIKFRNYRNDYAFAIALHQLSGQIKHNNFIPVPMNMLPHEYDVLELTDTGIVYKYNSKVNVLANTDVHVLDKELISVG